MTCRLDYSPYARLVIPCDCRPSLPAASPPFVDLFCQVMSLHKTVTSHAVAFQVAMPLVTLGKSIKTLSGYRTGILVFSFVITPKRYLSFSLDVLPAPRQ